MPGLFRHPPRAILRGLPTPASPYKGIVLADGPISYWRLGEASGTVAADTMGLNPGDYVNTPTLGSTGLIADVDTAVAYLGSSSQFSNLGIASIPTGHASRSVEAWVKTTAGVESPIYALGDGGGGTRRFFYIKAYAAGQLGWSDSIV